MQAMMTLGNKSCHFLNAYSVSGPLNSLLLITHNPRNSSMRRQSRDSYSTYKKAKKESDMTKVTHLASGRAGV